MNLAVTRLPLPHTQATIRLRVNGSQPAGTPMPTPVTALMYTR